jgi:hypothetical protein
MLNLFKIFENFINWVSDAILVIVKKVKIFLEYISNNVEWLVFTLRQWLVVLFLGWFSKNAFDSFCKFFVYQYNGSKEEAIIVQNLQTQFGGKFEAGGFSYTNIVIFELRFILFLIISQVVIQIYNVRQKAKNKPLSPNIFLRFFALIPYIWIWCEMTLVYTDTNIPILDFVEGLFISIPDTITNIPLLIWYIDTIAKGGTYAGFTIFVLFYYGIGRNRESFPYFMRYHYVQCVLFSIVFCFESHVFFLMCDIIHDEFIITLIANVAYSLMLIAIGYGVGAVFLGYETYIPFIHEAIEMHVGLKKNDNKKQFGDKENPFDDENYPFNDED